MDVEELRTTCGHFDWRHQSADIYTVMYMINHEVDHHIYTHIYISGRDNEL